MKISKAQQATLKELCEKGSFRCIREYKPAIKLVELGLATRDDPQFGHVTLTPTKIGQETHHKLSAPKP